MLGAILTEGWHGYQGWQTRAKFVVLLVRDWQAESGVTNNAESGVTNNAVWQVESAMISVAGVCWETYFIDP